MKYKPNRALKIIITQLYPMSVVFQRLSFRENISSACFSRRVCVFLQTVLSQIVLKQI